MLGDMVTSVMRLRYPGDSLSQLRQNLIATQGVPRVDGYFAHEGQLKLQGIPESGLGITLMEYLPNDISRCKGALCRLG